ncbi:IS3 family transposase [Streptomyces sp. NPDC049906]|uniref:IS3 family transposase n=1 Tax=Streptomyces sp. NPDC049906 TaxID=3155656 RepID=UPI00342F228A
MVIRTECVHGRVFGTRAEANLALFAYIDGSSNPRRIQKRLGHLSPIEYEEKHHANQAAAEPVNLKPRQPALTSQSTTPAQRGNLSPASHPYPARADAVPAGSGVRALGCALVLVAGGVAQSGEAGPLGAAPVGLDRLPALSTAFLLVVEVRRIYPSFTCDIQHNNCCRLNQSEVWLPTLTPR